MAIFLFENNASSVLASAITNTATALVVKAGTGIKFPSPGAGEEFRCVLEDALGNREIIGVTSRSTDNFTVITRANEGTAARAWAAGTVISHRLTAEVLDAFQLPVTHNTPQSGATETPISSDYLYRHITPGETADPHTQYLIADHVDESPVDGATGVPISSDYVYGIVRRLFNVRDRKTAGTPGGSFTSGSWQTRTLNTTGESEVVGASLASNIVTLPPGKYEFFISAPAVGCNGHVARLYNNTDAAVVKYGTTEFADADGERSNTRSLIQGTMTITSSKDFIVQHQCGQTETTDGFGRACGIYQEIYTDAYFWRIGD